MSEFKQDIHNILAHLEEVLVKKNIDYGNSFDKQMDEFGITAGLIRISDKFSRLKELSKKDHEQQVNDEALDDTVLDLMGYATLLYRYLQNGKK